MTDPAHDPIRNFWPQYTRPAPLPETELRQNSSGAYTAVSESLGQNTSTIGVSSGVYSSGIPQIALLEAAGLTVGSPRLKSPALTVRPKAMPDPTREEFDAKLATVEARSETRFTELSGKIDRVVELDSYSKLNNFD